MMTDKLLWKTAGPIAYLTLNRPEKINCIDGEMFSEMEVRLDEYAADDRLRCLIITGAGGNFSSGGDMKWFAQARAEAEKNHGHLEYEFRAYKKMMYHLAKPVIAAIDGYCLASGFSLAVYCSDIRVATERTRMATVGVSRGLNMAANPNQYPMPLTWYTGLGNALYMRLTGKHITGAEALRMGLVNEVVAPEDLLTRATELAKIIAKSHPIAVQRDKTLFRRFQEVPGSFFNGLQDLIQSTDHFEAYREGSRAFIEKREPDW